ncbi:hypothetical protein [Mycobacterium phage SWU1]|uniref:Uncharacterized protein n=1 Tax=Mycobacterium phage SWU1 TaxID=1175504 RepID=I1V1H1_9CAUD|nr:hypothetical protein A321_gp57 [Mycobacterium phage SWU1]AFI24949.1 hypothetical protein [Mycobacterium phage SWU1]
MGFGLNLQWHGEGDAVVPEAFRPIPFKLTFEYGDERIEVTRETTPDVKNDPDQMRWNAHKLWDSMVDALKDRGLI